MAKRKLRKTRHYETHPTFKQLVHAGMDKKKKLDTAVEAILQSKDKA
jgi:hypothetical protein